MEQQKEKLDRFISAVNSVTDKQVEEILAEAEEEKHAILEAAASAAEEASSRHLGDNLKMTSNKYVRMVSKAELEMKKEVLIRREQLTESLFEQVKAKLAEFTAGEEYENLLCSAISSESDLEDAKICVAPRDMRFVGKLRDAAGDKTEICEDDSIIYGGFYILRNDKGTITDRTYDCSLKEQQSLFASRNLMASQGGH